MANRLAHERSPYLLQHADNPVDWYAWGPEAFDKARLEDKPIFLSIGYSTCHWCHVMAHESFEDSGVAELLNTHFVPIKLDREERPDVDRVYMLFVQATTGAGGWPMSVWLTPDLKPFFGGTYFPPTSRWGRPGFLDVLQRLARAWQTERKDILSSADDITARLQGASGADSAAPDRAPVAGREALETGIASFAETFDARHGGFGGAPKFPRPSELLFLFRASAFTGNHRARQMALDTLRAMALGGVRDQIGGGFHRYSVDAEWRVPHFEKMLYDQAQLALAYLEAWQITGEDFYAVVAEDTLAYVGRELTSPDGAFYSAEDADSPVPGGDAHETREGAYYVWTTGELQRILGEKAAVFNRRFGVEPNGNALSDPQGEFASQNILYVAQSIDEIAARTGLSPDQVMEALAEAQVALIEARLGRPRPHLDDKVITAWNGLMIAAFARAARVLVDSERRAEWRDRAVRAAVNVKAHLWDTARRRLGRRYRDGETAGSGFAEDYAYLVWGLTELFEATGDAQWLEWAMELTTIQTSLFYDERDGGWFSSTDEDKSVLLRLKEDYDGAEPAAASVTIRNLILLGHLTAEQTFLDQARRGLERYGPHIGRAVRVMPFMVGNVALWRSAGTQVVLAGQAGSADRAALERAAAGVYMPAGVTIPLELPAPHALTTRLPWMSAMTSRDGRAAAYVCHDFTCREPIVSPDALAAALEDAAAPRLIETR